MDDASAHKVDEVGAKECFRVFCGSTLYGLETPTSDIDYGHVLIEPKKHLFGHSPSKHKLHQHISEEQDDNRHWLRDFAHLCVKGNPNAIEWLWAPDDKIVVASDQFRKHILGNASAFLALPSLAKSHFGFAKQQIKKMYEATGKVGQKRRNYVVQYGYDIKFAHHAIRLMYQLLHLVNEGQVVYPVAGEERDLLMRIKLGHTSESEVVTIYEKLRVECDAAVKMNKAGIPECADTERVNGALISFYEEHYYGQLAFKAL